MFINPTYNINTVKRCQRMPKEIIFRRKLIDNRGSLLVNIPAEIVEAFELEKGDEMEITIINDNIQLKPAKGN